MDKKVVFIQIHLFKDTVTDREVQNCAIAIEYIINQYINSLHKINSKALQIDTRFCFIMEFLVFYKILEEYHCNKDTA
jgi:hypothetical protein